MSFSTNTSNVTGKSTTNAFDIVANTLVVTKSELVKGDLTVLGNTNIGNVTLANANVDNLTVNHLTATNPIPTTSGGTGLATIGTAGQVLQVNPTATGLIYDTAALTNPSVIVGTGYTGSPTLNFGIEASVGSTGRGFMRTSPLATAGLFLGTSTETVLQLWSTGTGVSNMKIDNTSANFTYNSSGTSGIFQVQNAGGSIAFTNSGVGTISMATAGGAITLADPTALTGAVNISTGGGIFNLSTGAGATNITTIAGNINLTTGAGNISLTTAVAGIISITTATAGAINIGSNLGLVNIYGSGLTLAAPTIYIGISTGTPIPSALVLACGAVTGFTGAWAITTGAYQLNSASISFNSTATIALNNNSTVSGSASGYGTGVLGVSNSNSATGNIATFLAPNLASGNQTAISLGISTTRNAYLGFYTPVSGDIFQMGFYGQASPSIQLQNFATKSIALTGDTTLTGALTVSKNIYSPQNINAGVLILNNGNTALTVDSPKTVLIRGGSGSTITLPNATTLTIGFTYEINNNSNNTATIVDFTNSTITTVLAGQLVIVYLLTQPNTAGTWDYHISGNSTNPSFNITTVTGNVTGTTSGVLNVNNTATNSGTDIICLQPSLASGQYTYLELGVAASTNNLGQLFFQNGATTNFGLQFYNSGTPSLVLNSGGSTTINGPLKTTAAVTGFNNGVLWVENQATSSTNIATFLSPNIASLSTLQTVFGKSLNIHEGISFSYYYDSAHGSTQNNCNFRIQHNTGVPNNYFQLNGLGTNYINGQTYVTGSTSTYGTPGYGNGLFIVTNDATASGDIATFLSPNLASGNQSAITFGVNATRNGYLGFYTPVGGDTVQLGFYGLGSPILQLQNVAGNPTATLTGQTINLNGIVTVSNTNTSSTTLLKALLPSATTNGNTTSFIIGQADSTARSASLSYIYNSSLTACQTQWQFNNQTTPNINMNSGGTLTLTGLTYSSGTASSFTDSVFNVTNTNTNPKCISTFYSPNIASGNYSQIQVGQSISTNQSFGLAFGKKSSDTNNTFSMNFSGNGNPNITFTANGTLSLTSSTMTFDNSSITASSTLAVDASKNVISRPGGSSTYYNATANTNVTTGVWTSVANLTIIRQKGNGYLISNSSVPGYDPGFTNSNAGKPVLVTVSFNAHRSGANALGVDKFRIMQGPNLIAKQQVAAQDEASVAGSCYLNPLSSSNDEIILCQIWQNSGSTQSFDSIAVAINTYPCPVD